MRKGASLVVSEVALDWSRVALVKQRGQADCLLKNIRQLNLEISVFQLFSLLLLSVGTERRLPFFLDFFDHSNQVLNFDSCRRRNPRLSGLRRSFATGSCDQ